MKNLLAALDRDLDGTDLRVLLFLRAMASGDCVRLYHWEIAQALGIARCRVSTSMAKLKRGAYVERAMNGVYRLVPDA